MENKISINLRRFVTILIAVLFTEHISAQDNIVVPQIQPSVQAPSPISIKIAAEISGKRVYYSTKEWKNMPVEEKIKINTLGVIVSQGNERFMFALNPLSYKRLDWKTAQVISGNQMPTKKQWQIILQNEDKILRAINKPGTIVSYGNWWCSDTKSYMASMMLDGTANRLVSANYDDEAGVWLATNDIENGFKEVIVYKADNEEYDYVGSGPSFEGDDCLQIVGLRNKYGFVDTTGKVVIPIKYDDVDGGSPQKVYTNNWSGDGLMSVCINSKWGYIDGTGKVVVPIIYDKVDKRCYAPSNNFRPGITRVCKEGFVGGINHTGTFLLPIEFQEIEDNYEKDLFFVKKDNKYGFYDTEYQLVIPFKYDFTSGFSDGLAVVGIAGKYGYINEKGEAVIPSIYDFAAPFCNGLAAVVKNNKLGYINQSGEQIIPLKYQVEYVRCYYDSFSEDYRTDLYLGADFNSPHIAFVKSTNGKLGIINRKGELVVDYKYDRILSAGSDGKFTCEVESRLVYIDAAGNEYQTEEERKEKSTEKMAKQGYADAQYRLGCQYLKEKNYELAHEWLLKAVEQGNVDAITAIARDYNARKEYKLAYDWYVKAFNCGVVESLIEIGDLFYYKEGLERSYAKATDWYLKYIEYPDQSAHNKSVCFYRLGYMYYYGGYGIQASYTKALDYFRKSDAYNAKYFLGWMYEHGQGTDIDVNQAIQWYEKSGGYKDSKERIIKLKDRQHTTSGIINGHEWVDLGLSVKWATCNVGATKPSDFGDYFAWGETITKNTYSEENHLFSSLKASVRKHIENISGNPRYDVARAQWGAAWRMPTYREFKELIEKCQWTRTEEDGHEGYKVTGPNGNSIFLPGAGMILLKRRCSMKEVYYWSSSSQSNKNKRSYYLRSIEGGEVCFIYSSLQSNGYSVRPVVY